MLAFLLYTIIGFWLLGIISKWALRAFILRKQRQMEEQFGSGGGGFSGFGGFGRGGSHANTRKSEGEVTIEQTEVRQDGYTVNKKIGEYVEFEEVETAE